MLIAHAATVRSQTLSFLLSEASFRSLNETGNFTGRDNRWSHRREFERVFLNGKNSTLLRDAMFSPMSLTADILSLVLSLASYLFARDLCRRIFVAPFSYRSHAILVKWLLTKAFTSIGQFITFR